MAFIENLPSGGKSIPVEGDLLILSDSEDTNKEKHLNLGNLGKMFGHDKNKVTVLGNLQLPNYDHVQSTIHPSVIYEESGLFGYKFWMAHTPYPSRAGVNPLEYPAVCASNDGIHWIVPRGCPLTIWATGTDSPSNTYQHFADTTILKTHDGKLRVYWIASNDSAPTRHGLLCMESVNGIDWTPLGDAGFVLEVSGHNITSPTVILEADNTYTLFAGKTEGGARDFAYRTSPDGITWGAETVCTMPANYRGWHTDVKLKNGVYHMLVQQNYSPARTSAGLSYISSTDKLNWTGDPEALMHGDYINEPKVFAGGGYYRSTFIIREDGLWDMWFSSLISEGCGDGDSSGDYSGNTELYLESHINMARGVDPTKENKWNWVPAPNLKLTEDQYAIPGIHNGGDTIEIANSQTAQKGFFFRYTTEFPSGLLTGERRRITAGEKPWMTDVSNKGLGSLQGELKVCGVIGNASCGAHIIASRNGPFPLSEINVGEVMFGGNKEWYMQMSIAPDNLVPANGDIIVGLTSGATGKIHIIEQAGRLLYPKEMSGTAVFANGEQVSINGTTLTNAATPITIVTQQNPPVNDGINIMVHYWYSTANGGADNGGYIDIWNSTAESFHGNVDYRSFR